MILHTSRLRACRQLYPARGTKSSWLAALEEPEEEFLAFQRRCAAAVSKANAEYEAPKPSQTSWTERDWYSTGGNFACRQCAAPLAPRQFWIATRHGAEKDERPRLELQILLEDSSVRLKTAKALGSDVSDMLIALVDEIIDQHLDLLQCIYSTATGVAGRTLHHWHGRNATTEGRV